MKIRLLNRIFSGKEVWALRYSFFRFLPRLFSFSVSLNLIKVYISRILRLKHLWGTPYLIMVEPTSRCNLSCPMCGRTFPGLNREERDLSLAEFGNIFNQVKSRLLAVGLWNLGEPLLNESLFDMVRMVSREKIFSIVLSNGTLLDKKKADAAVDSGLDYLGISMDGASASTYNKYRSGADFKQLVANIEYLSEEKKRRGSLTPFIEIIFLVMKDNEREINDMIKLSKRLGANKLSLKKISLSGTDNFIRTSEILPANPRFIHAIHADSRDRLKKYCIAPWFQVTINADGNVIPCCGGYRADIMGNVFAEDFSLIWNGPKFKDFRGKLRKDIDAVESCRRCAERSYDPEVFINPDL